ncbi:G protein pathway suppressor 2-like isoform X2 [Anneissia japonica]|uniref:G protein pathway suppressor 2-like isoform X2 n=1 Tax=Anneissia japonica TaxID=1529436 RepID=UPI00142559A9|nr:G protein pathway suppressor 2-like isoform X2 [Anneissia japonica]
MPALLRPKLSKAMSDALKHHILKERERKRQEEEEADKAIERKREEKERLRKKAEAETLSLEETKVQIKNLEKKLQTLQDEKHELFLQLKKVLNEDDNRRKAREKEKSNLIQASLNHHQYLPAMRIAGPHLIVQGINRPALLGDAPKNVYRPQTSPSHSIKRNRSPSPPLVQLYPHHPHTQGHYSQQVTSTYASAQVSHSPYRQAHGTNQGTYTSQQHGSYAQPHSSYTSTTQPSSKYQARDPAYANYNHSHFVQQQKELGAQFTQGGYIHQPHQPRYLQSGTSHTGEPPSKQPAYSDEQSHYSAAKAQQAKAHQQHVRPVIQSHTQALHQQQAHQVLLSQQQQQQQQKAGVIQGYPPRRKQESPVYAHKKPQQQQHQQQQHQQQQQQHQQQQHQQQHSMTSKSGYQGSQAMRHSAYQDRPYM